MVGQSTQLWVNVRDEPSVIYDHKYEVAPSRGMLREGATP
jgi:hypothetical protein